MKTPVFSYLNRNLASPILLAALGFLAAGAQTLYASGTWVTVANQAPESIDEMLLLSDGTVLAAGTDSSFNWYRLTPSATGSYAQGAWSQLASMHDTRLYYSSQVLTDGRVLVAGSEYFSGTATSEIYDPLADIWTLLPPSGQSFSDSISKILPDGSVLVSPVGPTLSGGTVIFRPTVNSWTAGPKLFRGVYQDEASWVKLPDDSILTIDPFGVKSERYIPTLNRWVNDATVPVSLYDPYGSELGPAFLLPDGRAFFIGSLPATAFYTPSGNTNAGVWQAGPAIPNNQGMPDAPGAMMANGKILLALSPTPTSNDHFPSPTRFYEFDPTASSFTSVNGPTGATFANSTYPLRMLVLPDGNILMSISDTRLYIYQPDGAPLATGKPGIASLAQNPDGSYLVTGTNFNGISQGAAYGDDAQMDSNYPLVRMIDANGHVFYARTFSWSSTGVQTGTNMVSTSFTLPPGLAAGTNSLVVVANGIASDPTNFISPSLAISQPRSFSASGPIGGPFAGASQSFTLSNAGNSPLSWSLVNTSAWVAVTPAAGVIAPGGTSPLITASLTAAANQLFPGNYTANLTVTNSLDGSAQSRIFNLQVTAGNNFQPFQSAVTALQPVGYWRLDETNSVPLGGTATNLGSLAQNADGYYQGLVAWVSGAIQGDADQAASFLGGGSLQVPYISDLSLDAPFTVEAWVNAGQTLTSGNFACAFSCGEFADPRSGWLLYQSATGWDFRMYDQNGTATSLDVSGGTPPVPGVWYHVAVEYDGTSGYIYVNGSGNSATPSGFVPNVDGALTIGCRSDNAFNFNGLVDEFAVYNSVLPQSEIAAHYMRGTNAADPTPYDQLIFANSPLIYFRLDTANAVPPALNAGTAGAAANGAYELGVVPGVPGAPIAGLGATNFASFFNGLASYVYVPGTDLDFTGAVSIMAWIQSQPANGNFQTIAGAGDVYYRLNITGGGIPIFADGNNQVAGPARLDDGQWHHVAGVFDGTNSQYLYVDGQLAASQTNASAPVSASPSDFWIGGALDYGVTRIFNGAIDEVAVFNQALTGAQISQVFRSAFDFQPVAGQIGSTGNLLNLNWSALAGRSYQLQFTTNLAPPVWLNLGSPLVASNSTLTATDSISTDSQRFYRLMLLP